MKELHRRAASHQEVRWVFLEALFARLSMPDKARAITVYTTPKADLTADGQMQSNAFVILNTKIITAVGIIHAVETQNHTAIESLGPIPHSPRITELPLSLRGRTP